MVNLQAQLAYLREEAVHRCLHASAYENPNERKPNFPQDLQSWFQMENSNTSSQFLPNMSSSNPSTIYNGNTTFMDPNPIGNYEYFGTMEESISSFSSFDDRCNSLSYEVDNLQGVASFMKDQW